MGIKGRRRERRGERGRERGGGSVVVGGRSGGRGCEGGRERVKYGQRSYGGEGWIEREGGSCQRKTDGKKGRETGERGRGGGGSGKSGVRGREKEREGG